MSFTHTKKRSACHSSLCVSSPLHGQDSRVRRQVLRVNTFQGKKVGHNLVRKVIRGRRGKTVNWRRVVQQHNMSAGRTSSSTPNSILTGSASGVRCLEEQVLVAYEAGRRGLSEETQIWHHRESCDGLCPPRVFSPTKADHQCCHSECYNSLAQQCVRIHLRHIPPVRF